MDAILAELRKSLCNRLVEARTALVQKRIQCSCKRTSPPTLCEQLLVCGSCKALFHSDCQPAFLGATFAHVCKSGRGYTPFTCTSCDRTWRPAHVESVAELVSFLEEKAHDTAPNIWSELKPLLTQPVNGKVAAQLFVANACGQRMAQVIVERLQHAQWVSTSSVRAHVIALCKAGFLTVVDVLVAAPARLLLEHATRQLGERPAPDSDACDMLRLLHVAKCILNQN